MSERSVSIWRDTTPGTSYPSLKENITTDVAIIGGGMAGVVASYYLTRKSIANVLLEKSTIGRSTSGNTTAKVTSFHDLKYSYLVDKFGREKAKIYAESNQWAIDELESIVKSEHIDCDFKRVPLKAYALDDAGVKKLQKEYSASKKLNLPVSYPETDKSFPIPVKAILRLERQACFHPGKFLLHIAENNVRSGARIFENTEVLKIENSGTPLIRTSGSEIRANKIIIATNYPIYDKGFLFIRMNQVRSYAIAAKLSVSFPESMYIGAGENDLYLRPYSDQQGDWLITSGGDHITGEIKDKRNPFDVLESELRKYFDITSVDYRWAAQDSMPVDRVPFIGKMPGAKHIYVTTGFGEWGMTTSFVSGKLLTDLISGTENIWEKLYTPSRVKPFASFHNTANLVKHVTRRLGIKMLPGKKFNADLIKKEEGKIFSLKGKKSAVFRDESGILNAVSASCTHLGCIVKWNSFEKTWDCPCHGSRFSTSGEVLNSPAVKPLEKIEMLNL